MEYGTHSMRRIKPSLIYKKTKNLRAVQLLLGHTKLDSTVRYLDIEVDFLGRNFKWWQKIFQHLHHPLIN